MGLDIMINYEIVFGQQVIGAPTHPPYKSLHFVSLQAGKAREIINFDLRGFL